LNNILTFNELKEIAKKIAMDDDRVEKLYIEQLETQSMSSDVNFFNVLYLVKDLSFDDASFEFIEHFGDVLTMFENTENENVIEYRIIYENFTQGIFRIVSKQSIDVLEELEEKYICVLNKDENKKSGVYIEKKVHKLTEDEFLVNTCEFFWNIELDSLWIALFNICGLFRKLSLQIAINLRFDYAKELDRDTVTYLRELKQKANSR